MIIKINIQILFLIIFIFFINSINSTKQYVYKQYENKDCTGDIVYMRALVAAKHYCFRTLWFHFANLNCEKSEMGDHINDADCYMSELCECQEDSCKTYFKFGQCFNGTVIHHEKLNYLEKDYCVVSEGDDAIQIGRYKPDGVTVAKRDYCYDGTKMDCDILTFSFIDCESDQVLYNSPTLSLALQLTPYGNISFYLGDLGYLTAPTYYPNNSNSLFKIINYYYYYNYLILSIIITIIINFY